MPLQTMKNVFVQVRAIFFIFNLEKYTLKKCLDLIKSLPFPTIKSFDLYYFINFRYVTQALANKNHMIADLAS